MIERSVAATATPSCYDRRSIRLHWTSAVLVAALWCLGQTIDWFPKDMRIAARSAHISLGVALAAVLGVRIWWRLGHGRRLPAVGTAPLRAMTTGIHHALYILVAATVALGAFNAWVRGDSFFGLLRIPAFDPGNKPLRAQAGDLHALCANLLIGLAGFHAAAGLAHHFIWKDGVLQRMWPARRPR